MNGIWHARTSKKIMRSVNDSQFFSSLPTFLRTFVLNTDPKKNTPRRAIDKYMIPVTDIAMEHALKQF